MDKALMMEPFVDMEEILAREHTPEDRWLFVDIRPREEFREGHIPGSMNVPVEELDEELPMIRAMALGRTIVLVTHEDHDAQYVFDHLEQRQIGDCLILKGGVATYKMLGKPLEKY